MNEFFPWIAGAVLLATIQTGGGTGIGRDVEAGRDFVGHDQIIHADRGEWRRYVDDKMRQNQDDIMD